MPERYYSSYTNLIKYTKKLSRLNTREKEKIEKIKKEIEETESVADKKWLLQKLKELSGS